MRAEEWQGQVGEAAERGEQPAEDDEHLRRKAVKGQWKASGRSVEGCGRSQEGQPATDDEHPRAISSSQKQPEATRSSTKRSGAIRSNQTQRAQRGGRGGCGRACCGTGGLWKGALWKGALWKSALWKGAAIRGNRKQSEAIRGNYLERPLAEGAAEGQARGHCGGVADQAEVLSLAPACTRSARRAPIRAAEGAVCCGRRRGGRGDVLWKGRGAARRTAIRGTQRHFDAIRGTPRQSERRRAQQSEALRGNQRGAAHSKLACEKSA